MTVATSLLRMRRTAVLSEDRLYRYELKRLWRLDETAAVNFIMLNPSTADETQDDATIRMCMIFARQWGFGGIIVTNLFAFRARDPYDLLRAKDPIGEDNDRHLLKAAAQARRVVCAWGANPIATDRAEQVCDLLIRMRDLYCLALTAKKMPRHPLYLRRSSEPVLYRMRK